MGNENTKHINQELNHTQVEEYRRMRPNLSEKEVQQIYKMFVMFKPENG